MGRVERLLRATKLRSKRSLEKAYRDPEANQVLRGARMYLCLSLYETENYLPDIFSEAIAAASFLKL